MTASFTILSPYGLDASACIALESNDHVHLSEVDAQALGIDLSQVRKHLGIAGQWACTARVTLINDDGTSRKIAVLGPSRKASQVELAPKAYATAFGIAMSECPAPRNSGEISGCKTIQITGPNGNSIAVAALIPREHAHSADPKLTGKTIVVMAPSGKIFRLPIKGDATTDGLVHFHFHNDHMREWEASPTITPFEVWIEWMMTSARICSLPAEAYFRSMVEFTR